MQHNLQPPLVELNFSHRLTDLNCLQRRLLHSGHARGKTLSSYPFPNFGSFHRLLSFVRLSTPLGVSDPPAPAKETIVTITARSVARLATLNRLRSFPRSQPSRARGTDFANRRRGTRPHFKIPQWRSAPWNQQRTCRVFELHLLIFLGNRRNGLPSMKVKSWKSFRTKVA